MMEEEPIFENGDRVKYQDQTSESGWKNGYVIERCKAVEPNGIWGYLYVIGIEPDADNGESRWERSLSLTYPENFPEVMDVLVNI